MSTIETNEKPAVVQASVTITSKMLVNLVVAACGAGSVIAVAKLLQYVGSVFTPALPYMLGGVLFATIISGFFMMLRLLKQMRRQKSLRISFSDAYTGVAVFVVMGYFATACMHAFQGDGMAFQLWTQGVWAAGFAATGYGFSKGVVSLWKEGKAKS